MPILQTLLLTALLFLSAISQAVHGETFSASQAAGLYEPGTQFTIFRKGKKIGTQTLSFTQSNSTLTVNINSAIKVTALKIPVFRFDYQSKEVWKSDALLSVETTTKTGKKLEKSSLLNDGNISELSNDAGQVKVPLIAYATNHWNISAVKQSILFNTIKGVPSNIKVENLGTEELRIGNTTLNATHYVYTGDIEAQSWYDENNRWVKLVFLGSDGSEIIYTIDKP